MNNCCLKRFAARLASCVVLVYCCAEVAAEQTDAPPSVVAGTNLPLGLQDLFRANLQLQEQLHDTSLALEQNQKETEAAAARNAEISRNAELMSARLKLVEQELASQRAHELEVMRSSNRFTLIVGGSLASVLILAALFTACFAWRAARRIGGMPAALPLHTVGEGHAFAALGAGQPSLMSVGPAEQSAARLLGAIDRLEQRILQLEHMGPAQQASTERAIPSPQPGTVGDELAVANQPAPDARPASSERAPKVALWLGKGQSLLNLSQPEGALACFDEALKLDPGNAEALTKKGEALERLEKLDEAIASYDRAIAADRSMTIAYLHKGGLCNRLARHSEALECYEQALQAQKRNPAA